MEDRNDFELIEPQRFTVNRSNSLTLQTEQLNNLHPFRRLNFDLAGHEEHLLVQHRKKQPVEKLTSISLNKVIVGSIALVTYGTAVFIVQLFYLSKDL